MQLQASDLEADSELQLLTVSIPRQETRFDDSEESYSAMPSLSMLRIDPQNQETLLQPSLRLFGSLAESNLLSPPDPLLHFLHDQDRELTTTLIYHECDSLVSQEDTMQSQQEVGGILGTRLRQGRAMNQERYESEEFRCIESPGKLKHNFADIV